MKEDKEPYGGRPPFERSSDTSKGASDHIHPSAATLRGQVLEWIFSQAERGATCDESEVALRMKHQTCSARIRELVLTDHLVNTGLKRKTRAGVDASIYTVPSKAPPQEPTLFE
jgi:hypothetical protein